MKFILSLKQWAFYLNQALKHSPIPNSVYMVYISPDDTKGLWYALHKCPAKN